MCLLHVSALEQILQLFALSLFCIFNSRGADFVSLRVHVFLWSLETKSFYIWLKWHPSRDRLKNKNHCRVFVYGSLERVTFHNKL